MVQGLTLNSQSNSTTRDWALAPNAGGQGSIPGRWIRSCMLQLKMPHATVKKSKMLHAANKPSTDSYQFSSVAQSCLTLRPHELQHTRPPCPSPTYIYILKPKLKKQHRMMLTRGWGVGMGWCQGKGEMLFRCTNSYINKSWRSNVQYSDYRQWY